MSAMVIASSEGLAGLSKRLEGIGISNIHFYNSRGSDSHTPMLALVPFVDFVVIGSDAADTLRLSTVLAEARARHVPVIREESIEPRVQFP